MRMDLERFRKTNTARNEKEAQWVGASWMTSIGKGYSRADSAGRMVISLDAEKKRKGIIQDGMRGCSR